MRSHPSPAQAWSRALAALLLLSALLAIDLGAPPAARAAGADALDFGGGATSATFGANAVVRIDGRLTYETRCSGGIPDWIYPATDVYLVQAAPAAGAKLKDVGGGPPNTIVSPASMFLGEILAITGPTGSLGEGTYSVIYDTCQDGTFDPVVDTVFADAVTVRMPAVLPPASMALVDLKGAAEEEAHSWLQAEALFGTIEKVKDIPGLVRCLMSPSVDCAAEIVIGEGSGKLAFSAGVTDQFKKLMLSQAKHYAAIAADPPDPDFQQVTVVEPLDEPTTGDGQVLDDALADTLVPLTAQAALAQSLLHAVERYQGAQVAGDAEWALTHARQAGDLADALAVQVAETRTALAGLRSAVSAVPAEFDAAHEAARDHVQRIWMSGFTPEERRLLLNLGLSAAEVAARETQTRRAYPTPRVTRAGLLSEIDALLDAQSGTTAALASAATSFGAMAADLEAQPAVPAVVPVASAGGPYSATQGVPTTLDGTASSTPAGSTLTTFAWDTDADGAFDDATGPSPTLTLTSPEPRLVGLRVVNSHGRAAVSYTTVTVAASGAPPALTEPVPATANVVVTVGSPQSFTISGADPDGDAVSYAWLLDGQELTATGAELDFSPTAADVGTHVLEVRASDGTGAPATSWRWELAVVDIDADGDGWTATSDCDDTDAAVSPGAFERIGNAVDDDCDPGTTDAPPGGLTGTPWSWGSNVLGQIGTGTSASYVRPPAQLGGLDDVVQVESGFRLSFALKADGRVLGWGSNFYGSVGDGASGHRNRPVSVVGVDGQTSELTGVTQLSSGGSSPFTTARRSDGTVVAWGENRLRQLGDGSTANHKLYPVRVLRDAGGEPLEGVRSVENGSDTAYAHMDDGTVRTWGYSMCGGGRPRVEPYPVALTALGDRTRQISAGYVWTAFRMADGSVLTCGGNGNAHGRKHTLTEPAYEPHQINTFGPGSGVIDVSAGYESGVALKDDGSVWMWGWNGNGSMAAADPPTATTYTPIQVPLPPGPPVIDVENAEACHTQALRADGSILIWGCDTHGSSGIVPAGTVTTPTVLQLPADAIATSSSIWNGLALARPVDDTSWERPAFWVEAELADATTTEGADGGFDVTLSQALPHDVTLTWAVEPGTADAADLELSGGTATVAAGATTARIPAPVVDDALHEDDETYTLVLTDVSHGVGISRSHATGTVVDDDAAPSISVEPLRVNEGSTGLTDAVVAVRLSSPSGVPVTVELATADGSAVAPDDYTQHAATVTVPAGHTSAAVHLAVHGDQVVEPEEAFTVQLSSPSGATLGEAEAEVTIVDDEPLALVVTSPTVEEGDGGGTTPATFQVSLEPAPPAGTTVTVMWTVAAGTAGVPDDVLAGSGTLTLAEQPQEVTASVVADEASEPDESFALALGEAVASDGRLVLPGDVAPATILDDDLADVPPVVEAGPDVTGDEGADVVLTGAVEDPDSTPALHWSVEPIGVVDAGATCSFADAGAATTTVRCTDDGSYRLMLTADDGGNPPVADDLVLTVDNVAPSLDSVDVAVASDGTRTVSLGFSDPGVDEHTCTFRWGDGAADAVTGATGSTCSAEHVYPAGKHMLTVEVRDDDGGSATADRSLLVYAFDGFFRPVDNPPAVNAVKAGRAIPIKFSLGGDQGSDIFADGYPASVPVSCSSGAPVGQATPTQTPGSSALSYARGSERYQYVWKTERAWADSCRQLVLRFAEGSERTALFRFR